MGYYTNFDIKVINEVEHDLNDIKRIINEVDHDLDNIKEIIEECNGPFYDFGLIHNHKVYIKHLVKELGIRLDEFRELEIKYTNYYMDEIDMVLIEHVINIKDKDDYIQSGIINKKLI